jgi:hypothetical protein
MSSLAGSEAKRPVRATVAQTSRFADVLRRAVRCCAFCRQPRVVSRASLDPGLYSLTRFGVFAPFRRFGFGFARYPS